jgi:hypothetical protein
VLKIKPLGSRQLKQVINLLEENAHHDYTPLTTTSNYRLTNQPTLRALKRFKHLYIPVHRLNLCLPLSLQFLPGLFVATSKDTLLGFIGLSKDGRQTTRWRIDQLLIDPNQAMDVTQLIQYAIHRYGAEGVETFIAFVMPCDDDAMRVLNAAGFRNPTQLLTYHYPNIDKPDFALNQLESPLSKLRVANSNDSTALMGLYNSQLPVEHRGTFKKNRQDFYPNLGTRLTQALKGDFSKRWVLEDVTHNPPILLGSVALTSENFIDFTIDILLHPGWQDPLLSNVGPMLLQWGLMQAKSSSAKARVFCNSYHFATGLTNLLVQQQWTVATTLCVLVKDYWNPIHTHARQHQSPIMLFDPLGVSPVCSK